MLKARFGHFFRDPVWANLSSFSLILFFIFLSDGLLSYWVPNFLQDSLKSPLLMGFTMSFSSFIGFGADLIFPQVLKGYTVRKLLLSGISLGFFFILSLALGIKIPNLLIFLIAMAVWGIYYEYIGFATQQFVADSIPLKMRASGWGIIDVFKNLAYFLGPLLAGYLLISGEYYFLLIVTGFAAIGLLIFFLTKRRHERPMSIEAGEVNIWRELSHWRVLFKSIWPVVFLSLFVGLIDAAFWTTGAVWSENLSKTSFWGNLILPAYQLPSLFMGFALARSAVYSGKKKLGEKYLLLSGLSLCLLALDLSEQAIVILVFVSSIFLAVTYPLIEAVYSDITSRMGVERKHLVGLSSSTLSLAYIIGPTVAGFIAGSVGEKMTFVAIGAATVMVSIFLLIFTPKKLRLPESEISTWTD